MQWSKWVVLGLAGAMLARPLWAQASEKQAAKHAAVPLPEAKTEDLYAGNSLKRWMPKAERGDIFAQYVLGHMYCVGQGVPKDMKKGLSWYQRAADQGFAPGQLALGSMYYNGEGVKQDYTVAAKWFRLAAERGYDRAQSNLAAMYMNGTGVPKDYTLAIKWFRAAAESGLCHGPIYVGQDVFGRHGHGQAGSGGCLWFVASSCGKRQCRCRCCHEGSAAEDEQGSDQTGAGACRADSRQEPFEQSVGCIRESRIALIARVRFE